jgi:hypothetical protein
MEHLTRRSFLALTGGGLLLAACGDDDSSSSSDTTSTSTDAPEGGESESGLVLAVQFADGISTPPAFTTGTPQRAPFAVADASGLLGRDAPDTLEVIVSPPTGESETITLEKHHEGIPIAYYPWIWTPPAAGFYGVSLGDERVVQLAVAEPDEVATIQIGDPMRVVDTPTVSNDEGIEFLCTRPAGQCPFHDRSLTEIAAEPGPIALLLATPGFCQTEICGPVLDLLVDEITAFETIRAVHSEIYVNPTDAFAPGSTAAPELVNVVNEYGLSYEPSLVIADADHNVTARLDFTFDRTELREALAAVG